MNQEQIKTFKNKKLTIILKDNTMYSQTVITSVAAEGFTAKDRSNLPIWVSFDSISTIRVEGDCK